MSFKETIPADGSGVLHAAVRRGERIHEGRARLVDNSCVVTFALCNICI